MKKYSLIYIFLIALIALSGCTPAVPAQPYIPVETIVAATYAAISAQTEAARPTATPIPPTATATRPPGTATPTPTATFVLASFTPSFTPTNTPKPTATNVVAGSGNVTYSCNIISLSPENGTQVKAGEEFDWIWRVENIGNVTWTKDEVMVIYSSGAEYAKRDKVALKSNTAPGQTAEFRVRMLAPKQPGRYTTTWSMRKGIHYFCYAQLQIYVVK